MKKHLIPSVVLAAILVAIGVVQLAVVDSANAGNDANQAPDSAAVERTRENVQLLDNIFKQTVVLITDKYVHSDDDFAAGSAAVALFKAVSDSGDTKVRLIDATGDPYKPENVAQNDFEKRGIQKLKGGAKVHEEVVSEEGKPYLRVLTPVPVVMDKCVMCHAHYADLRNGEPIGAISYRVPIK